MYTLLYGLEYWTIKAKIKSRILTTEIKLTRKGLGCNRAKSNNIEVLNHLIYLRRR